jgi:hypothetical protein
MPYTSDYAKDIQSILTVAETELRTLVEAATSKGNYSAVVEIANVAASLRALAGTRSSPDVPTHSVDRPTPLGGKRTYPFFTRNGGELVKTGYSSSTKSDYQHRAPREIVDAFATALDSLPKSAKAHFTMESVLPLHLEDRKVPAYQPYLVLAWFRELRLVKKDGRVGYTVTAKKPLLTMIATAWQSLPSE